MIESLVSTNGSPLLVLSFQILAKTFPLSMKILTFHTPADAGARQSLFVSKMNRIILTIYRRVIFFLNDKRIKSFSY